MISGRWPLWQRVSELKPLEIKVGDGELNSQWSGFSVPGFQRAEPRREG